MAATSHLILGLSDVAKVFAVQQAATGSGDATVMLAAGVEGAGVEDAGQEEKGEEGGCGR